MANSENFQGDTINTDQGTTCWDDDSDKLQKK